MSEKKVVITGIGVLASNAIGKNAFWEAIFNGVSGIKPISLFDTGCFRAKSAGEIKDFSPQTFLGDKGLRTLDRSTKLIASAAKLALDDAGLEINEENSQQAGVAVGTTFGSIKSICDFDLEGLKEGVRYVNPALFPNTVINSPASEVSIKYKIRGFNATISTGFCASLDAANYARDFLRFGRAKIVLAGGVEELCQELYLGFYKTKFLSGLDKNKPELACPFDKRRNGIVLGEAGVIIVLEDLESALARKANILAQVAGFGTSFDSGKITCYNPKAVGLKKAMRLALEDAGLEEKDINGIFSGANSRQDADWLEANAIKGVFAGRAKHIPVSAIKSMTGECFSASGALQIAAAAGAIQRQEMPPTINYQLKDRRCVLNCVANQKQPLAISHLMVNCCGPNGANTSMIISRYN